MEKDPRDIVERCRRGDARAWDEFVDRYQRLVWSVARSCRLPAEDCDDVTQTVTAGQSSVTAMKGSTEESQFVAAGS